MDVYRSVIYFISLNDTSLDNGESSVNELVKVFSMALPKDPYVRSLLLSIYKTRSKGIVFLLRKTFLSCAFR